jgi:hypothetical protein
MTLFVPSSAAEPLSQALWGLSRPPQARGENDTRYLFSWITDLKGERWLVVLTDYEINVHPEAELADIADILQPWIAAGHLPADTNTELARLIELKRGDKLVVYDAFPALFKLYDSETNPTGQGKTYEMMIAAGLLANPQTQP